MLAFAGQNVFQTTTGPLKVPPLGEADKLKQLSFWQYGPDELVIVGFGTAFTVIPCVVFPVQPF